MTRRLLLVLIAIHLAGLAVIFGRDGLTMSPDRPHLAAGEARSNPFMLAEGGALIPQAAAIIIERRFGCGLVIGTTGLVTFCTRTDPAGRRL